MAIDHNTVEWYQIAMTHLIRVAKPLLATSWRPGGSGTWETAARDATVLHSKKKAGKV